MLIVQRAHELRLSARNTAHLRALGAREQGGRHFPLLVLVHVLMPAGILWEVLRLSTRPGPLWPLWLVFLVAAEALRLWSMRALGPYWTARIWVVPGMTVVRDGPYRFLRHPSYLAAAVELAAAPLLFGAWRTAIAASMLNAAALIVRIRAEERALRGARTSAPTAPTPASP